MQQDTATGQVRLYHERLQRLPGSRPLVRVRTACFAAPGAGATLSSFQCPEVRRRQPQIPTRVEDDLAARKAQELFGLLARLHLAPVSDPVLELARATSPVNVRALDALHVATAQVLSQQIGPLDFWTHDSRQAAAALARGLDVHGI